MSKPREYAVPMCAQISAMNVPNVGDITNLCYASDVIAMREHYEALLQAEREKSAHARAIVNDRYQRLCVSVAKAEANQKYGFAEQYENEALHLKEVLAYIDVLLTAPKVDEEAKK